jgi:hypothetical protein
MPGFVELFSTYLRNFIFPKGLPEHILQPNPLGSNEKCHHAKNQNSVRQERLIQLK